MVMVIWFRLGVDATGVMAIAARHPGVKIDHHVIGSSKNAIGAGPNRDDVRSAGKVASVPQTDHRGWMPKLLRTILKNSASAYVRNLRPS